MWRNWRLLLKQFSNEAIKAPDILYHYTTQAGILGITKNKEVWMTHTQYLNDSSEFHHAIETIKAEVELRLSKTPKKEEETTLKEILDVLEQNLSTINVCVSCFSEVGDSLSQWRAYGSHTSGYSLGFNSSFLSEVAKSVNGSLVKCIYDNAEKKVVVSKFLDIAVAKILKDREVKPTTEAEHWSNGYAIENSIFRFAPILKDSSFADEKEWRIISAPLSCKTEGFDYRQGSSMIIPYYKLPLIVANNQSHIKPIDKIYIGPTPNKEQSLISVRGLLLSSGWMNVRNRIEFISSSVPYRSW